MDSNRVEGSVEQMKGAAKEFAGDALGDSKLSMEGKADKVAGKVQNTIGGIADTVSQAGTDALKVAKDATSDISGQVSDAADAATRQVKTFASELENMGRSNPLGTIAVAVVVGVVIGMLGRGRS